MFAQRFLTQEIDVDELLLEDVFFSRRSEPIKLIKD